MDNKCVICGVEFKPNDRILVLTLPTKEYVNCCIRHEYRPDLQRYINQFVKPGDLAKVNDFIYFRI